MGAFNAGTTYAIGDSVDYNGSSYIMFALATAGTLPTNTTYWEVLANKGVTGSTGATGATGAAGANGRVLNVVAGTNISVDSTNPANPIVINTQDISGKLDIAATTYALLAGRSGGQTLQGDTASGGNLTLMSTAHATKGKILFGTSAYDEINNRLGIGTTSPTAQLHIVKADSSGLTDVLVNPTAKTSGNLLDLQLASASKFSVDYTGQVTAQKYYSTTATPIVLTNASPNIYVGTAAAVNLVSFQMNNPNTVTSGQVNFMRLLPAYNQSGATSIANTDLLVNRTETNLGTTPGTQCLIDLQVAGASKFRVQNNGYVSVGGTLDLNFNGNLTTSTGSNLTVMSQNISNINTSMVNMATGTFSSTSGTSAAVVIKPIYNQVSGTAANTDLLINRTETAVGNGAQNYIDCQVAGTSKFTIGRSGKIVVPTAGGAAVAGAGTLSGGTATISTTAVTANSLIFVTDTGGGVLANIGSLYISAKSAGTSFTVTSTNVLDSSTFSFFIIN